MTRQVLGTPGGDTLHNQPRQTPSRKMLSEFACARARARARARESESERERERENEREREREKGRE